MKVVVGIDSGVNGGICVLFPDKAAYAAPVGNITELRDILSAAKKYADAKSYILECFCRGSNGLHLRKTATREPFVCLGQVIRFYFGASCRNGNSVSHGAPAKVATGAFGHTRHRIHRKKTQVEGNRNPTLSAVEAYA